MIKEHKEINGSDDWLKKELERESRISPWDLDDASRLRDEHAASCDAAENAQRHHIRHVAKQKKLQDEQPGKAGATAFWIIICVIILIMMVFLDIYFEVDDVWAPVLLFLCINPGLFIWLFAIKRMPPNVYYLVIILIALYLEWLALSESRLFRFYLFRLLR